MTETTAHKHSFPCNPPGGSILHPGPCSCGKTSEQDEADRFVALALEAHAEAYGTGPLVAVLKGDAEALLAGTGGLTVEVAARVRAAIEAAGGGAA